MPARHEVPKSRKLKKTGLPDEHLQGRRESRRRRPVVSEARRAESKGASTGSAFYRALFGLDIARKGAILIKFRA